MKINENFGLSRRGFLKWSTAAASLAAGLTACSKDDGGETVVMGGSEISDNPDPVLKGGKWVTVPCPECPRFRCVNRAYVVDGIPVRQKTQDDHPFTTEYPQYRSCIKGRAMKWSVFSPDRIKYPMKRKNWKPGGTDHHPELRGKDEWVRITWAEALSLTAQEFKRISETYGSPVTKCDPGTYGYMVDGYTPKELHTNYAKNYAATHNGEVGLPILNLCYTATVEPRFLNYAGYGSMPIWGQNSTGGWPTVTNKMLSATAGYSIDRFTFMDTAKLVIMWGKNPTWSDYGSLQLTYRAAKERGAKIICIDPWFNPGNNALADQWIPVRPGTDVALLLAIAHELITNNWVDQNFLDKHVVGFDEASMDRAVYKADGVTEIVDSDGNSVKGADGHHKYKQDCFKNYVMGTSSFDNVVKNAEWASKICGTPVALIKSLAKDIGTIKPMYFLANQSTGRHYNGGTMAQAFHSVAFMRGTVANITGGSMGSYMGSYYGFAPQPNRYFSPGDAAGISRTGLGPVYDGASVNSNPPNPKAAGPYGEIGRDTDIQYNYASHKYYGTCFAEAWDAVLDGEHHDFVNGKKKQVIRGMIKLHNGNNPNQIVNLNKAIQAHRKPEVEFIFASDSIMTTTTRYADIVVPCTSRWEDDGHYNMLNQELFIGNMDRIFDPLFEARSSFWVDGELCRLYGAPDSQIKGLAHPYGRSQRENVFNGIANMRVIKPDGSGFEPLIKFTEEDLDNIGINVDLTGADRTALTTQGRITYQEFREKGFYQIKMNEALKYRSGELVNYLATDDHSPSGVQLLGGGAPGKGTETGMLEMYSMNLVNYYKNYALEDSTRGPAGAASSGKYHGSALGPIALYMPQPSGYEEARDQGIYPLQYVNVHPHIRVHSARSDNRYITEFFDDVMYINPVDAQKYGNLKNGDTALFTSKAGRFVRRVAVTNEVMPGVVVSSEGCSARRKMSEDADYDANAVDPYSVTQSPSNAPIDYAGSSNVLCPTYLVGQGHQAFNTVILKMEKFDKALVPQYKWPVDLPAFDESGEGYIPDNYTI